MHIDHVTINLTPPSAIVQAFLAALTRMPADGEPVAQPETSTHTPSPATPVASTVAPRIGEPWPGIDDSAYAGVSRGEDGQSDGHLVLLADTPDGELKWNAAVKWAEGLGDGARLPTRFESALLYANLRDKLETDGWHWIGTQYSDSSAWTQYFSYGSQGTNLKSYEGQARAVRRFAA